MQNEAKYAIEKFKITIFDQFSIFIAYMDIAGYGSTNCSKSLDYYQLPVWMA